MSSTGEKLYDDFIEMNTSVTNESLSITKSYSSSSLILEVLLTNYTPLTSFSKSPTSITSRTIGSVNSLVDQINSYYNIQILARIKQCNSNMTLNDICETYSIDNKTNLLITQPNIEFSSLEDLFDRLVNRLIIQKLNKLCLSTDSCLGNLSENNIQFINEVIQKHGYSFCLLEQCHSRLSVYIDSCPILSNTNISIPTLKLLPMLCTLYNEQQNWNSTQCIEEIIYFLHVFYAFWPQFETCYDNISTGFDGCTQECQTFDNILNKIENRCNGNASFLSQVPALAWHQSINVKEICYQKNSSTRPSFIYSVEKFFSSTQFWYRFYEKPLYIILFLIIIIFFVISFSLCFYLKSKYCLNSNNRQIDDNYEYTRLHNSSFELETNTEIPNMSPTTNGMIDDESQFDSNDDFRSAECQRLLFVNT